MSNTAKTYIVTNLQDHSNHTVFCCDDGRLGFAEFAREEAESALAQLLKEGERD